MQTAANSPPNSELVPAKSKNLYSSKSFIASTIAILLIGTWIFAITRPIIETRMSPDFPLLQGTWKEIAVDRDGGSQEVENPIEHTNWLIVSGRNFKRVQEVPDRKRVVVESGAILLKKDGKPKGIDFRIWLGSVLGIYEVDGDRLTLCVGEPVRLDQKRTAKSRPEDFTTAKGDGRRLLRYERTR